jgi:hypothetical protein
MRQSFKAVKAALGEGREYFSETVAKRTALHTRLPSSFLYVNSCSWIRSQCSRFLLRKFSRGWFYIKIVTGMLMLSKLYLLAIFNLQIYIMLKLLVSR